MSHSVSQLPDEAFADFEPSFVDCILDDAQGWAERVLREAESAAVRLEARYATFLSAWVDHPTEDDEDASDRSVIGDSFRGLIDLALEKAQEAREVIVSGETSLRAALATP